MVFLIPSKVQGHTVPYCKALRYGKNESRRLSCGNTLNIRQNVLKSENLLYTYKLGFVDSQSGCIVSANAQYLIKTRETFISVLNIFV